MSSFLHLLTINSKHTHLTVTKFALGMFTGRVRSDWGERETEPSIWAQVKSVFVFFELVTRTKPNRVCVSRVGSGLRFFLQEKRERKSSVWNHGIESRWSNLYTDWSKPKQISQKEFLVQRVCELYEQISSLDSLKPCENVNMLFTDADPTGSEDWARWWIAEQNHGLGVEDWDEKNMQRRGPWTGSQKFRSRVLRRAVAAAARTGQWRWLRTSDD